MKSNASEPVRYYQYDNGKWKTDDYHIIVENQISLTVNGDLWFTMMCTPVDVDALAIGFLFNEGIISSVDEVGAIHICPHGDNVDIWLHHNVQKPEFWRRTSGCTGGITSVNPMITESNQPMQSKNGYIITAEKISELINKLLEEQILYRKTGGVHTSVLTDGDSVIVAEDIGRHNTLDKIAGRRLLEKLDIEPQILMTTGRISSEMLQKAARLGARFVISRTSPTSLSILMAEAWGITLIGYARRNRFNVYSHPEAIIHKSNIENPELQYLNNKPNHKEDETRAT